MVQIISLFILQPSFSVILVREVQVKMVKTLLFVIAKEIFGEFHFLFEGRLISHCHPDNGLHLKILFTAHITTREPF